MHRRLGGPGDAESRRAYGQCWKVETIMVVTKRRFGEALTARINTTQQTQALPQGVTYNINRLAMLGVAA